MSPSTEPLTSDYMIVDKKITIQHCGGGWNIEIRLGDMLQYWS